jgi:peptidoglycan hydrolase CwlO-like protein
MKTIIHVAIAFFALATIAMAQTAPALPSAVQSLGSHWNALETAKTDALADINKLILEKQSVEAERDRLKKENDELKAKARAENHDAPAPDAKPAQ